MNWIILNDRRYLISPLPLKNAFILSVPGERTRLLLDRQQMITLVRKSLGLSGEPQMNATNLN
ncbi:hypothetical protein U3C44_22445 (plasmid) [Enterobacter asburiae]|jgi:hypothetical protein|uniref:hypothetical protein n=1 Tax=Enterobacter asburiae TaxID=61645 RepID=UPI002933BEA1|nr:hypothetical protein [Enterobacter asburiae]EMA4739464.1 hypothetical protein [Enterobacter asburiae]